jgi:hypothetical protein
MRPNPPLRSLLSLGVVFLLAGCNGDSHAPSSRPDPPDSETSQPAPLDLIYVCGNKYLATNATRSIVTVTYRVAGTTESGSLILREEPGEEPGFSETELETIERGTVELYLDG